MHRLSKYGFYMLVAISIIVTASSCGPSKKTTKAPDRSINGGHLTREQQDEFTSIYFDATKQRILGNYNKAIDEFKQCLSLDPMSAAANFQVADMFEYFHKPDSAMNYAARAAQMDPSNTWYQDIYAQCLQDKGLYKQMEALYESVIKNNPDNIDYYYKLALAEIEAGEYQKAADTYDKIEVKQGGFNEEITREKIKIYEQLKDFAKAEAQAQRLISHDSTSVGNYVALGDIYEAEGKNDKAFELYRKLEQLHPDDASVHLSLADSYRQKKDDKKSFEELDDAFKLPGMDLDSKRRILLSFMSLSNGHDSMQIQAMELCKSMVQASPESPEGHQLYGDLLYRQADYKGARDQFRATVNIDSSKYVIWSQLMGCDIQLNDYEDLAKVSASAMDLFPNQPEPYLFNGVANTQRKNYDNALSSLNKGMDYVVSDNNMLVQFYASLGEAYNAVKRYSASDSAYEAALKINPNNDNVLNNYSYYLSERDTNLVKAEQMSKKSNDLIPNNGTYLDTYAWILYKEGNYKGAKEWEDKSIANGGLKDAAILDHYGDILFKLGDKDNAMEYWQKAKLAGMNTDLLNKKIENKQLFEK